ncbi:solute carrier family 25 member 45-like [Pecten maximus]|uniref:solute carrier family 25 member 45-like n=1 Tax=Pecten maximus TaxID=6579 RepID=UPI0014584217|nr:solute carrier family 25 member 45-like [Pecten maximus]
MAAESPYHDYIAGALGGTIGYAVGYPFDTTKTQLQTQLHGNQYKGFTDAFRHIYRQQWIKGFYRGMSWPLITVGVTNSIFFGVYGNVLKCLEPDREKRKKAYSRIFLAGCLGGAAQSLVVIPIDYIKVVLQSQIRHEVHPSKVVTATVESAMFRGPMECARYICRTEGLHRLYKGAGLTMGRDIPCFGVYGLTYMYISGKMKERGWCDSRGLVADLFGGGLAGITAWLSVMPVDVVKSRYQADCRGKFSGYINCAVQSYREEGLRVFYRGSMAICLRSFSSNAVEFMVYAQVMRYLQGSDHYSED